MCLYKIKRNKLLVINNKALVIKFTLIAILAAFSAPAKTYKANPDNYLTKRDSLQPGDSLLLEAGDYESGLSIIDMNGLHESWIVLTAEVPHTSILKGRDGSNTMDIRNSSYIKIEGLKFDGMNYENIDAIKAGGSSSDYSHHIWIENNIIENHGNNQQTVGISTKITSWDWTIRKNKIIEPGTGIYLGNSDGNMPFIRGVIEFNLVLNPIGYCMQIKHQNDRPDIPGIPMENVTTIIRHNVFAKDDRDSPDGDRPNLLVSGTFPEGPGSEDRYEIYGNFLYYNPREYLFQGSGNISLHNNIFANSKMGAVNFQEHHERKPKELFVYCNTIYNTVCGIRLAGADVNYDWIFKGNAVYTAIPVNGIPDFNITNITGAVSDAASIFSSPSNTVSEMDFYPISNALNADIDLADFSKDGSWNFDFNNSAQEGKFYGAYSGEGINPGWKLALDIKELDITSVKEAYKKSIPCKKPILKQNYPNPFNISTCIDFIIPYTTHVSLAIYNVKGEEIATLINRKMGKGEYSIRFGGKNLPSGVYIVKLKALNKVLNKKIILLNLYYSIPYL